MSENRNENYLPYSLQLIQKSTFLAPGFAVSKLTIYRKSDDKCDVTYSWIGRTSAEPICVCSLPWTEVRQREVASNIRSMRSTTNTTAPNGRALEK